MIEPIIIDSLQACYKMRNQLHQLIVEGDTPKALTIVESLTPNRNQNVNVSLIKADIYAQVGFSLGRADLIEKGTAIWRTLLKSRCTTDVRYNLARSELKLWLLAVKTDGNATAWLQKREHLHEARQLYEQVAQDLSSSAELRMTALTAIANSYDFVGRYLDAIDCYGRALEIDPSFGMALGNRAIALLDASRLIGAHEGDLVLQAAADLDAAMDDRERVLEYGGQEAIDAFGARRDRITIQTGHAQKPTRHPRSLGDPHLDWCLEKRLFLHNWHDCIHSETEILDPVLFKSISFASTNVELDDVNEILDAFNAIKRDYTFARYEMWLAVAPDSTIVEQIRAINKRSHYRDTWTYANWNLRTGFGIGAMKAAVDLLDKIAVFVHLFFDSGRGHDGIYFHNLPYEDRSIKGLSATLAKALERPEQNKSLLALFDLSSEVREQGDTFLGRLVQYRHAATHRFCVVHMEGRPEPSSLSEHLKWDDLIKQSLDQLELARRAVMYLARTVDEHEQAKRSRQSPDEHFLPLVFDRADPNYMELE